MSHKPCAQGSVKSGDVKGKDVKIGGLDAYVTGSEGSRVILFITDIYGYKFPNARLYADKLADRGSVVVVPDYFHGDSWTSGRDFSKFGEWVGQFPQDKVLSETDAVLADIRKQYPGKPVGVIGFCWGGLYGTLLAATDKVSAVSVAHVSMTKPEMYDKIKQPYLIQYAEKDQQMPPELKQNVEAAKEKASFPFKSTLYPGTSHGFAVRADADDAAAQKAADEAFQEAAAWLQEHLN